MKVEKVWGVVVFIFAFCLLTSDALRASIKESVPFSGSTRTKPDSGYKGSFPQLVVVAAEKDYNKVTDLINTNASQILYDFVPYNGKYVYFFVFAGKTDDLFDEMSVKIKDVTLTEFPTEVLLEVVCSIEHRSVPIGKNQRASPWQSAKALMKDVFFPTNKSYRLALNCSSHYLGAGVSSAPVSVTKNAASADELVNHDQLIVTFNKPGVSQKEMTGLEKRFDAKVIEHITPPNPGPADKLVRVLLEVGDSRSVEETISEYEKLPEVGGVQVNHFYKQDSPDPRPPQ